MIKLDKTLKYVTFRYYIRKMINTKCISKTLKINTITVTRNQINKYIFSWKLKENISNLIRDYIIPSNFELKVFGNFYRIFKLLLKEHDFVSLKKLLKLKSKYKSKYKSIRKFIESLNKDYKSVINTAKYKYNNSQVERQVSKLKRIKHHMYGRAKIDILRNKSIYQSYFC